MDKVVAIDTNLYLDDSNIIYKLSSDGSKILIPLTVLKELDKHKRNKDLSYSARMAIHSILNFKSTNKSQIIFDAEKYSDIEDPDDRIIESAKKYNATLATKDVSMSISSGAIGVDSILHDMMLSDIFDPYIHVNIDMMFSNGNKFSFKNDYSGDEYYKFVDFIEEVSSVATNKDSWWFLIINNNNKESNVYAHNPITLKIERIDNKPQYRKMSIDKDKDPAIKAMDVYQMCAIYAMKEAPNALICGSYGSGKSLLATMYALANNDNKTFISRPNITVDRRFELGFLPGPQPLSAKVLTPTGWTTMGSIMPGDYVISASGKKVKVLKTFDKGERDVYRVETTNGGVTHACGDHVWATKTHNELKHRHKFKLRSTIEIRDTLLNSSLGPKYNHTLPMNGIVEFDNDNVLSIPPYTLGVLLGDGCLGNSISFTSIDDEIVRRVEDEIKPLGLYLKKNNVNYTISGNYSSSKPPRPVKLLNLISGENVIYESVSEACCSISVNKVTIGGRCSKNRVINNIWYSFGGADRWRNGMKNDIYNMGLEKRKSYSKFIPDEYKYTSIENRIALLQGLMDTDGTIKKSTGEQSFTTVSKQLADDVVEVARSLGMNATIYKRDRRGKGNCINGRNIVARHISYEVCIPKSDTINIFHIKRKADFVLLPKRNKHVKISKIEYAGREQVKCIKIDSEDSLYITDDFIVTHNTMESKLSPWMAGFISSLYYIFSNTRGQMSDKMLGTYDYVREQVFERYFEMVPLETLQGMSFMDGDLLLLDEAQLCSISILSVILSRFGKGSKLIMTGDIKQTYNVIPPSENGLLKLLRLLPNKYMAFVELKNNYRSELLELANELQNKTL